MHKLYFKSIMHVALQEDPENEIKRQYQIKTQKQVRRNLISVIKV